MRGIVPRPKHPAGRQTLATLKLLAGLLPSVDRVPETVTRVAGIIPKFVVFYVQNNPVE